MEPIVVPIDQHQARIEKFGPDFVGVCACGAEAVYLKIDHVIRSIRDQHRRRR